MCLPWTSTSLLNTARKKTSVSAFLLGEFALGRPHDLNQQSTEKFDNVGAGKYTVGLGQQGLAFVNDREDIYSICLTGMVTL